MPNLCLSIAVGNYDRCRPLFDGEVQIDGVDPVFMKLGPEEIFFRAFRGQDFDISELSLSSTVVRAARGDSPYVAIPVFLSRVFRHNAVYVRTDRIKRPEDLKGKKIGLPEYQLTANVWVRAFLKEDFGVSAADVIWVRGGIEHAGRPEKIAVDFPKEIKIENAPEGRTISDMLRTGDIDGFVAPRPPALPADTPNVGPLFPDPIEAARQYYGRTRIFPIMHVVGIRRSIADAHPWLPMAIYKAFDRSKDIALDQLRDTSATKVTLPFIDETLRSIEQLMGRNFWPYGIEANRHVLENFLRNHFEQGLSPRQLVVEELFHPGVTESFKI